MKYEMQYRSSLAGENITIPTSSTTSTSTFNSLTPHSSCCLLESQHLPLNMHSDHSQLMPSKTDLTGVKEGRASPLNPNTTPTPSGLHSIQIPSNCQLSNITLKSQVPQIHKICSNEVFPPPNWPSAIQRSCTLTPAPTNDAKGLEDLKNNTKIVGVKDPSTRDIEVAVEQAEITGVFSAHSHWVQLTPIQAGVTRGPTMRPSRMSSPSMALWSTSMVPYTFNSTPTFHRGSSMLLPHSFTNTVSRCSARLPPKRHARHSALPTPCHSLATTQ